MSTAIHTLPVFSQAVETCHRWRVSTGPSERETIKQTMTAVGVTLKQRYYNAQLAALVGDDCIQYVRGYVDAPEQYSSLEHVWNEISEKVAEITFPYSRPNPPENTVYFGGGTALKPLPKGLSGGTKHIRSLLRISE